MSSRFAAVLTAGIICGVITSIRLAKIESLIEIGAPDACRCGDGKCNCCGCESKPRCPPKEESNVHSAIERNERSDRSANR